MIAEYTSENDKPTAPNRKDCYDKELGIFDQLRLGVGNFAGGYEAGNEYMAYNPVAESKYRVACLIYNAYEQKSDLEKQKESNALGSTTSNKIAEDNGVHKSEGQLKFEKGKSYLIIVSKNEIGAAWDDLESVHDNAHLFGYNLDIIDIDNIDSVNTCNSYLANELTSKKYDCIIFGQHGTECGPQNCDVTQKFSEIVPYISNYFKDGGTVVCSQCYGQVDSQMLNDIKGYLGVSYVYVGTGKNVISYNGYTSYMPVPNSQNELYRNRYKPWVKQ